MLMSKILWKEKQITELEKVITGHETQKKSLENKLSSCRKDLPGCLDDKPSSGRIILPREGEAVPMEFSFEVEINVYNPKKRYYLVKMHKQTPLCIPLWNFVANKYWR